MSHEELTCLTVSYDTSAADNSSSSRRQWHLWHTAVWWLWQAVVAAADFSQKCRVKKSIAVHAAFSAAHTSSRFRPSIATRAAVSASAANGDTEVKYGILVASTACRIVRSLWF